MLGAVVDGVAWLELGEALCCWLISGLLLEGAVLVEDGVVDEGVVDDGVVDDGVVLVWDD